MSKHGSILIAAVTTALTAFAVIAWAFTQRWQISKIEGKTVRIDRWTGKSEVLVLNKDVIVRTEPIPLSDEVRKRIQVFSVFKMNYNYVGGPGFSAKIYNGSDIRVEVVGFKIASGGVWREINIPGVILLPKTESSVTIPLSNPEKYEENTLTLVSAYVN